MIMKKISYVFLVLSLASFCFGGQSKTIKDALGYSHIVNTPPQKIISLAPNLTEILFALDLGKKVVGVTRYCDYPKEALEKEKIGGLVDLNLEKIKALNPDLIIGFRGNPLRILKRLKSLQLPVFTLEMGTSIESIYRIIHNIGVITIKGREAEMLIHSIKKEHERVQLALRDVSHQPKVFFILYGMGLWTGGKDSFINDITKKAKGINIAGQIQRKWLLFNREQLIHENPEFIIIISKSQEQFNKAKIWMKNKAYLETLRAVQADSIYFLDENLATRPGPRIIQALAQIARILHPHCFTK